MAHKLILFPKPKVLDSNTDEEHTREEGGMEGLLSFPVLGPPSFGAAIVFYFGHEAEIAHYKRQ